MILFSDNHLKIIAHRGNSSESPENTLVSFMQAIEMEVDYIECDIQLTKDKIPVVIHDSILRRTTDNSEPLLIEDLTLGELKQFDAGSWFDSAFSGERIPTLEEVLNLPLGQTELFIEIKKGTSDEWEIAHAVAKACSHTEPSSLLIASFDPLILTYFHEFIREINLALIVEDRKFLSFQGSFQPKIYALSEGLATAELIQEIHAEKKDVWVWTVDDLPDMERLVALGIDGIITNFPKTALKLREKTYAKAH